MRDRENRRVLVSEEMIERCRVGGVTWKLVSKPSDRGRKSSVAKGGTARHRHDQSRRIEPILKSLHFHSSSILIAMTIMRIMRIIIMMMMTLLGDSCHCVSLPRLRARDCNRIKELAGPKRSKPIQRRSFLLRLSLICYQRFS